MIVILKPNIQKSSQAFQITLQALESLSGIDIDMHTVTGNRDVVTQIFLLGDTSQVSAENIEALPAVQSVVRISSEYKLLGKSRPEQSISFDYNGVSFSQSTLNIFAGLCAVDNKENVRKVFKLLQEHNQVCTRMGVYKPRTSPYAFHGLGKDSLPFIFEAAGEFGIKVIAMEVTHEKHIEEIAESLDKLGNPTGVMLQVGTRNAQNFELLKSIGGQSKFPILFKRGFGITLHESILAAEYLANAGNKNIVFCLRGVKSLLGAPHRNLVDVAHVSVVQRLTQMPVGFDPSHSVGDLSVDEHHISDISHTSAQAVIAGANLLLTDIHPNPPEALVDSRQAISLKKLPWYLQDVQLARECFLKRIELAKKYHKD